MRGKLIFLCGIDGSGKSTILKMLQQKNEKGNTEYTSCIANAVFEEELYKAERELLFSRKEFFSREFKHVLHIGSVIYKMYDTILPIINSGKNVVLDRYVICIKLFTTLFLSSPYHCLANALDCLPTPDFGIYFNTDINIAYQRIQERSKLTGIPPHYSESKKSLELKKIGYETMIPNEPYTILRVNANQDVNKVYSSVSNILNEVGCK